VSLLQELQQLDPRDPGRWPLPVRLGAAGLAFVALSLLLSYLLVYQDKNPQLEQKRAEELALRDTFRTKHLKAVNLEVYEQQLKDIERSFGALLRQLPGKTEVPSLLVDISQTGLAAGLERSCSAGARGEEGLLRRAADQDPALGQLPRLRRIRQRHRRAAAHRHPAPDRDQAGQGQRLRQLTLDLTARTYRYLDEDEMAVVEAERRKREKKKPRG